MKLSVVIPTLNEERYISGILGCLAEQTFGDFEVFVIDANSTDKTKEVVSSFQNKIKNLKFVNSPKKGVSFQRNYGASLAQSGYVLFFDADVLVEPVFLEKIFKFISNNPSDFITCWNIPISKRMRDKMFFWGFNALYMESLKKVRPVAVGTFIGVKKDSFTEVAGFDETLYIAEDMELAERMHKMGYKYTLLRDPVVYFSVRRYDEVGRFKHLIKTIKAGVYYYTKGQIKEPVVEYDMSGNHK